MHVLVVSGWYPSAVAPGRGSFVADQVRGLARQGVEIVVASWEPSLLSADTSATETGAARARAIQMGDLPLATPRSWGGGVPVARLPATIPAEIERRHPVDLMRWQTTTLLPFGNRLAQAWPIDLIHAHRGLPDGGSAIALANALGVPLLTTEHDGSLEERLKSPRAAAAYRTLVGEHRSLVAVSRRLADQAAALSGLDPDDIDVIPNLVDRSVFRPQGGIDRDRLELLWVGSRKASKGMDALIRAVAIVRTTRPVRLRLIGQAPSQAEDRRLGRLADDLGLGPWVTFEPAAARPDVAAAMARAGLLVHPSPSESFGIVAVEALATGLPVVAVSPTVADLIGRDGAAGEVAAGPGPEALAAAIERALARLGSFDREAIVARSEPYGSDRVLAAIIGRYTGMIGSASGSDRRPIATSSSIAPGPATHAGTNGAVVLALRRRSAIQRVSQLPPDVSSTLTVVTSVGREAPPTAIDEWIEIDPDTAFRAEMTRLGGPGRPGRSRGERWLTAARHPTRTLARRCLVARRSALAATTTRAALQAIVAGVDANVPIVAIDAEDVTAVVAAGLESRLAPALLWWLADRQDAADWLPGPVRPQALR